MPKEAGDGFEQFDPLCAVKLVGGAGERRRLPGRLSQDRDGSGEFADGHRPAVSPRRQHVNGVEKSVDLADLFAVQVFEADAAG